ncbi:hypothetical protein MLD52_01440 [Puniceicoccaceae bacterium K14]|nr:hypothetical protein [Puniceicoccaceae bacterium K14]
MKNVSLPHAWGATRAKCVALTTLFALFATVCSGLEFYVPPDGYDTNSGTEGSPFLTMSKARDAVREALPDASEGIDVWFSEGTYYFPEAVEFGPDDSGSESVPVRYMGMNGETVDFSGARSFENLVWSVHSGEIMKASIGTGITCDVMFANGTQQVMARYPNFDPDAVVLNGTASDAASRDKAEGWADPSTGFVRGLHSKRWGGNSYRITGKNAFNNLSMEWVGDNNRGSGLHAEFKMVENIFEELDAPGEWFYDEGEGALYFYPPEGVDLASVEIELATTEELIRIVGTSDEKVGNLTFDNLTFSKTHRTLFTSTYEGLNRSDWKVARKGTVYIQDADSLTISNSIFDHVCVGGQCDLS